MNLFKKLSILGVVSFFALSFVAMPFVVAQGGSQNGGGSGLQLSPTTTEISAKPGEFKTFSLTLRNVTTGEINAQAVINDFESDGVSGTPKIIIDETQEKTPYSLRDMIPTLSTVNLKAGEVKQIEHTINLPSNAAPGAYFGALRYSAVPVNPGTGGDRQVSLTASVAHLLFVEVPGDVVQQIQLQDLQTLGADGKSRNIFKKPGKSALTIKNLGNGFSRPFGKVSVTKGSEAVFSYEINNVDNRAIVLPQSTRVFTHDMENISKPGKYKVTAAAAYGNGGEVVNFESSFWYLPLWFVAVLALVLVAIVVGGWMMYKRVARGGSKKSKKS